MQFSTPTPRKDDDAPPALAETQKPRRAWLKALLVVAVLAGAISAIQFTPVKAWLSDVGRLRQAIHAAGIWAYPLVVLGVAVMVGCGVPRLLLCGVGGAVLGFWPGLLLVCAGTQVGYYAIFLFVRWGGRDWVLHRWPKLRKWSADFSRNQGILTVILIRQIPIHGIVTNLCFGLSHIKHRYFFFGTAIGLFPEAIPATLVGTGLFQGSLKQSMHYLILAAAALVILGLGCKRALSAIRARRPDLSLPDRSDEAG